MSPAKATRQITLEEVEFLAHRLAREHLDFDEPIPPFETRFPHRLESCLLTPFQTFGKRDLYPRLADKAAILFYLMIKNHPFQNGNKRIAITTLQTFLFLNGKWLTVGSEDLYNVTKFVAQSPRQFKNAIVEAMREFIGKNLKKADPKFR